MQHVRAVVVGVAAMSRIAKGDKLSKKVTLTTGSVCSGTALRFLSSDATSANTADRTPANPTAESNTSTIFLNDQSNLEALCCYHF